MIDHEPLLRVGICDHYPDIRLTLQGIFRDDAGRSWSGDVHLLPAADGINVSGGDTILHVGPEWALRPEGSASLVIREVTIGVQFHWQRKEDQVFGGSIRVLRRDDGTLCAINEVPLEQYLASVISSEMSATAPEALLEAHAITSRSWLVAMLERSRTVRRPTASVTPITQDTSVVERWYTREDHDVFDVCADDHCQRYQGITRIISPGVRTAIERTRGIFLIYADAVCDARFYKACGGRTECFEHAWENTPVPYLISVADTPQPTPPLASEADAEAWILSWPDAFCNTQDPDVIRQILPSYDQETRDFFRWTVSYTRQELEDLIRQRGGVDVGTLLDLQPLARGPSGRLYRLRIVGSERTLTIGKELEIRKWLSPSHLYSSAFVVRVERGRDTIPVRFTLHGAGWGHGVGLCQIGAAVMAVRGYSAEAIVQHYFPGALLRKVY